jgi:adenine-specific DNA methylase
LNPVPVLLNRVLLEELPKHGSRLAFEVRKWGELIGSETEAELRAFYDLAIKMKIRLPICGRGLSGAKGHLVAQRYRS